MRRSLRARLVVLTSACALLGAGFATTPLHAPTGHRDPALAGDGWAEPLRTAAALRGNVQYWSSTTTRRLAVQRRPALVPAAVPDVLVAAAPVQLTTPDPPPPAADALRHAEPPALPEVDEPSTPPPLPVAAAPALEHSRDLLGGGGDARHLAAAGTSTAGPAPRAPRSRTPGSDGDDDGGRFVGASTAGSRSRVEPLPSVIAVELASCRWSPRSDTVTGTFVMRFDGGRGFAFTGGEVDETRGPGGPGRAKAAAAPVLDPVEVEWTFRLANGASARDGIPLHVVDAVEVRDADGALHLVPAPQDVVPLADAGCEAAR